MKKKELKKITIPVEFEVQDLVNTYILNTTIKTLQLDIENFQAMKKYVVDNKQNYDWNKLCFKIDYLIARHKYYLSEFKGFRVDIGCGAGLLDLEWTSNTEEKDEKYRLLDTINEVYKSSGFEGVITYLEDKLEYGGVQEEGDGLFCVYTGGWSEDEYLINALISPPSYFKRHYVGLLCGGAFYFVENTKKEIEMKIKKEDG